MNLENMKKLIEALKATYTFDMGHWGWDEDGHPAQYTYECKTPACIAGHAVSLARQEEFPMLLDNSIQYTASKWLGISFNVGSELFSSSDYWWRATGTSLRALTKEQVIAHLRQLVAEEEALFRHLAQPSEKEG